MMNEGAGDSGPLISQWRMDWDVYAYTARLFPDQSTEDVFAATEEHWTFTNGIPIPGDWFQCPLCGSGLQGRWWRWHRRKGKPTIPYRCGFSAKCVGCALLFYFGVALTAGQWKTRPLPKHDGKTIHWRKIKELVD